MPTARPRAGLPREALAFLRRKGLETSRHWLDVWREQHATAFTVAQMTELDLVDQTHREIQRAVRKGETLETFRGRLEPWLKERGWAPRGRGGDIPTRLKRIYDTNLRVAHGAGQWDRIQRTQEELPWLVYRLGPSEKHRPDHEAWSGTCLRVGDPWWTAHYPPNGWGCKCYVQQVARPPKGATTKAPAAETREWTHPITGEVLDVPRGIDPGWDYNPAAHAAAGPHAGLLGRLERRLAPGEVTRGRLRHARRLLTRHIEGPAFEWFVSPRAALPPASATPVAVLPPRVRRAIGAETPLLVLRERIARSTAIRSVPAERWADLQRAVDAGSPVSRGRGRWLLGATDGWEIEAVVREGQAAIVAYGNK